MPLGPTCVYTGLGVAERLIKGQIVPECELYGLNQSSQWARIGMDLAKEALAARGGALTTPLQVVRAMACLWRHVMQRESERRTRRS